MWSRAIISILSLAPFVFVACSSSGGAAEGGSPVDAAPAVDGDTDSAGDAAVDVAQAEVADAPSCTQSLDAWCAMPIAGCIRDWASALRAPPDQGCTGWSVSVCDGYDVLSWRGTDGLSDQYFEKMSGQLVAIVNTGYFPACVGGPANFVPPSACSPSIPLCDLLGEGGTDAPTDAVDSGGE